MSKENTRFHYAKHHGHTRKEFTEQGEVTQFNRIRVVDESASGEWEEFDGFRELNYSDWTTNGVIVARLSDGTLLYEGHQ